MKKTFVPNFVPKQLLMIVLVLTMIISLPGISVNAAQSSNDQVAKYVFMFIGDGMSSVQINAAMTYLNRDNNTTGSVNDVNKLSFVAFPAAGSATTYDASSFCPDSASTATSYSAGIKTLSGTLGMGNTGITPDKNKITQNIAEMFKAAGKKVGIVSTVNLDHATPAAYYAHVESRSYSYVIETQMANSNVDYFAGGALSKATAAITQAELDKGYTARDDKNDAYAYLASKGYTITKTKDEFKNITAKTGKVYAQAPNIQDSSSITYSLDTKPATDISLSEFVAKGIEVLNNDKGFFMMVESGKVDWACHANDAKAAIMDVIEFDNAVKEAVKFYNSHPNDTIIIVTGDHETGGMTVGQATTGYDTAFKLLENQKVSYIEFDKYITKNKDNWKALSDAMPYIKDNFGLTAKGDESNGAKMQLSEFQQKKLDDAFAAMKNGKPASMTEEEWVMLYGGYNPLSITVTHLLNSKAGIGWTSYSHTGVNVPVYAMGVGQEMFNGAYDNTDVFKKLIQITKIK